jgi:hypothetical protein
LKKVSFLGKADAVGVGLLGHVPVDVGVGVGDGLGPVLVGVTVGETVGVGVLTGGHSWFVQSSGVQVAPSPWKASPRAVGGGRTCIEPVPSK